MIEHKKTLLIIIAIVHLFFCFIFWASNYWQVDVFLSYGLAFFSVFLVIFASYLNYKKFILKKTKNHEKDFRQNPLSFSQKKEMVLNIIHFKATKDDLSLSMRDKIHFFTLFFTLFKFIAYAVLVSGFLFLYRQSYLNILAYICGISSSLIGIFIFILYVKKYESNKNH